MKFLFTLPYLFMLRNALNLIPKDCEAFIYFAMFIPYFICYEIISLGFIIVCTLPGLIIWPYFKYIKMKYKNLLDETGFNSDFEVPSFL